MNKSPSSSNLKCVIVNVQYGIGFALIDGKIDIETTLFNTTYRSKILPAGRNRINFNEEFSWSVDRDTLKYCRTANEMFKLECFITPDVCYGNMNWRQRIGYTMIKLNEFQVIGRDWDQSVASRNFKLNGSSSNCAFLMDLIIQDESDLDGSRKNKNKLASSYRDSDFTHNTLHGQGMDTIL